MPASKILRIGLTPGEPAGIGPDLCALIAAQEMPCEMVAVCDPELLGRTAERLGINLAISQFNPDQPAQAHIGGTIKVLPITLDTHEKPGILNLRNAKYVVKSIDRASQGCIDGLFDAMVTGPVHKGIINDAGIGFTGHTEHIAGITGGQPVMLLATPGLRVALATTHIPVAKISQAITSELLTDIITILNRDLIDRFAIDHPQILVCGLNPHAGENGHLGREEIVVIEPTLAQLRKQGVNLIGPLPADTLFTPKYLDNADAVLAMYHDQGLPVLKHLGFGNAVNITLGLPIIRTSVDHGTALDLAGTGDVDTGSLIFAIKTAMTMASSSHHSINSIPS